MTERIEEIEAREKAATSGSWRGSGDLGHQLSIKAWELVAIEGNSLLTLGRVVHRENLDFIAHAREDIPYLLDQLRDREEKLAAVGELLRRHASGQAWFDEWPEREAILKGGK